jgi:dipeptidyl-peptidase-4
MWEKLMRRILALPLLTFLVLTGTGALSQTKLLTNELIHGSPELTGKSVAGVQWIAGGTKFSYQETDRRTNSMRIMAYSVADGLRDTLVDTRDLRESEGGPPFRFTMYRWFPDEQRILFGAPPPERQYLSRLTPSGNLFLYDLPTKSLRRLTGVDEPQYNPKVSPDGKLLGLVRANNIFIIDVATGAETQLTFDGTEHVINGKFDWVYEEEFGISDGWQWSPDGSMIAYWQLDEHRVPHFNMIDYSSIRSDYIRMRYPKAGDANSIVRVGVVSLDTKKTTWIDIGNEDDMYIPRIAWTPRAHTLALQRMNRLQNRNEVLLADVRTGKSTVLFSDTEKTWISVTGDWQFLKSPERIVWTSERDGFNHIYLYDFNGRVVRQITRGSWEVSRVLGVDEKRGLVFFTGWKETTLEQHGYVVRLDGSGLKRITAGGFSHQVNLAPDYRHFLGTYSNVEIPQKVALFTTDGKMVRVVEDNPVEALREYALGKHEFFTFTTADGVKLNGWMIRPPEFDATKQYPLLMYVYGGPGSQTVGNSWGGARYLWHHMLAQRGYIVASVDGRGTGRRGKAFKSITYKNLGKWEVNDQIEAARYLGSQPFIDGGRIGIWGWSYGGYMASLTILLGADYFKTAIAVAPVTHWKFYDTIYTERFMQRPQDNPDGYRDSAPVTHAEKLKGNLLIVHGTTDDNVHWQNSTELVDALQEAGKQFQTMFYVNKNHSIGGGNARVHLHEMLTNFLLEKL